MPEKMTLLGLPNYVAEAYTTVSAPAVGGLVPTGLEASWLKTEEPSEIARLASLDPVQTRWFVQFGAIPSTLSGVALVNHNLFDGSDVRFVGYTGSTDPTLQPLANSIAPSAIVTSSNTTGPITNVDEAISSPDGLAIVPTATASPWSLRVAFPSLGTLNSLDRGMCFVLRVSRRFSGGGTPVFLPKITVSLSESGTTIRSLGSRAVNVDGAGAGQIFIFPFSPSELASPSGANVECLVEGIGGDTTTGWQYAALESIALNYDNVLGPAADSGWLNIGGDGRLRALEPTRSLHFLPTSPWANLTSLVVLLRSDQSRHDPPSAASGVLPVGVANTPDQFVQAGVIAAGVGITLERGLRRQGPNAGPSVGGMEGASLAGQSYGADGFRLREADPVEILARRWEVDFLQEEFWRLGTAGAFYLALEPQATLAQQKMTAFWARFRSFGKPAPFGRYRSDGEMLFAVTMRFEEKL